MLIYPTTTQIFFEAGKCWYIDGDQEHNKHKNPICANLISVFLTSSRNCQFFFLSDSFSTKNLHPAAGGGTLIPAITEQVWLQAPSASFIHVIAAVKHMFLKFSEVLTPNGCQCSQMRCY